VRKSAYGKPGTYRSARQVSREPANVSQVRFHEASWSGKCDPRDGFDSGPPPPSCIEENRSGGYAAEIALYQALSADDFR
jgi:hypothetical protein